MEGSGVGLQLQDIVMLYFSDFNAMIFFKYLSDASKKRYEKIGRNG